jgi:hypothetical protein
MGPNKEDQSNSAGPKPFFTASEVVGIVDPMLSWPACNHIQTPHGMHTTLLHVQDCQYILLSLFMFNCLPCGPSQYIPTVTVYMMLFFIFLGGKRRPSHLCAEQSKGEKLDHSGCWSMRGVVCFCIARFRRSRAPFFTLLLVLRTLVWLHTPHSPAHACDREL